MIWQRNHLLNLTFLSGHDILKQGIEANTQHILESGLDDAEVRTLHNRNELVRKKLETHMREYGTIRLFPCEFKKLFWIDAE